MGSGSSKNKAAAFPSSSSSTAPPSTEKTSKNEGENLEDKASTPSAPPKSEGAKSGSFSAKSQPEPSPASQTHSPMAAEVKGGGDPSPVPSPEAKSVQGSAKSSSSPVEAETRNTGRQISHSGERGGQGDYVGQTSSAPSPSLTGSTTASTASQPVAQDQKKEDKQETNTMATKEKEQEKKTEERVLPEASQHQSKMDTSLRTTNALVKQEGLLGAVNKNVTKLALKRALPHHISLNSLVTKMENLQVLDLSDNELGPQGVRFLCLALPPACSVISLSLAGNKTDTDTADSVGRLLTKGPPLAYLDVSSNNLGKDYFSRCAGQALKTNTTLQTLRAQSIGMVDARALLEGLQENTTLVELDLSNNQITDRQALGSAMATVLKRSDCCLQSLALAGCNMNSQGLSLLIEGLAANTSLCALNLNNNEFSSLQTLMAMVAAAVCHPTLVNLHLNDAKTSDQTLSDVTAPATNTVSALEVLSLNSSNLTDEFWSKLAATFKGRLLHLVDVDISNSAKTTAVAVEHLWTLSADDSGSSGIHRLTTAMNDMNGLPAQLTTAKFPCLTYLNARKVRFSSDAFSALTELITPGGLSLTTLVLDGIKLSGKKGLATLLENCPSSHITALSLSGCSLNDADLTPLAESLGSGFMVHMLKLSANRLTDATMKAMVEKLVKCSSHPLGVLDICENQITDAGVKELCSVYTSKSHTSSLHSANLAHNNIGKEGILSLLSCVGGKFPLKCLYFSNQSTSFLEADLEEIYIKVASVLGYTVKRSGETIQAGCSDLPSLPARLSINLRGLGGHAGELGPFLDCPAITTDASSQRLMTLTLENVLDICASLQGQKSGQCVVSREDWVHITGSDKDNSIPSWLQLAESRSKGVYLSNLPGNSTAQRLEAIFETEADCNIEEVFLVKDPVTKNNSGAAWVLFSDTESVDRAIGLYTSGQAVVFGTPFSISRLQVTVEESVSSEASDKARQEIAARQKARAAEDRSHRMLIQQNTEESWKRHAYRLAHPAYADGRIW